MSRFITDEKFIKKFDELRSLIRNSVSGFVDSSPDEKLKRIKRAEKDKLYFAETYFPHYCKHKPSKYNKQVYDICDTECVPVAVAGSRDLAKSVQISLIDVIHKAVFKKRHCCVIIARSEKHCEYEFLMPIIAEFETNDRLIHDFGFQQSDNWNSDMIITKSGMKIVAKGPKSAIKSTHHGPYRVDHILIEDMEDRRTPLTINFIKKILTWLKTDVLKSVNTQLWSCIFVCNYFSKRSIAHQILKGEEFNYWKRYIFKALLYDKHGKPYSIWEAHLPLKTLLKEMEEDLPTFKTERQQEPTGDDVVFQEEWFRYYNPEQISFSKMPTITTLDPSTGNNEHGCFQAIIVFSVSVKPLAYYVRHAWIKKKSKRIYVKKHLELSHKYRSIHDEVESNGFQDSLREDYDEMVKKFKRSFPLKFKPTKDNKLARIGSMESPMEKGLFHFIKGHSDQDLLRTQLLDFPDGDLDGPDALSLAKQIADRKILKLSTKVKSKIL